MPTENETQSKGREGGMGAPFSTRFAIAISRLCGVCTPPTLDETETKTYGSPRGDEKTRSAELTIRDKSEMVLSNTVIEHCLCSKNLRTSCYRPGLNWARLIAEVRGCTKGGRLGLSLVHLHWRVPGRLKP